MWVFILLHYLGVGIQERDFFYIKSELILGNNERHSSLAQREGRKHANSTRKNLM